MHRHKQNLRNKWIVQEEEAYMVMYCTGYSLMIYFVSKMFITINYKNIIVKFNINGNNNKRESK